MSIIANIFRRIHYGVAKTIVPVSPARNAAVKVPGLDPPMLGDFDLLKEKSRCSKFDFDHLIGNRCGNLTFVFTPTRSQIVSLLEIPATREHLQWKSVRIGTIDSTEYRFPFIPNSFFPLLKCPETTSHSLEISTTGKFLSEIEFYPLLPPQILDCLNLLGQAAQVSRNLFVPLGKARADGKAYKKADVWVWDPEKGFKVKQENVTSTNRLPQNDGAYQKSYRETRNPDGSRSRQQMTVWDLLWPLLQPPLSDLGTQGQVLLPGELLPHQPDGVRFLASNEAALLGDGVQTGKTIQTVVAMKLLFQTGEIDCALIVCPIPLLIHWQKQLEKWAPELWRGLTVVRNANRDERRTRWRMPAHVYATNYETLVADFDEIKSGDRKFSLVVADEIQKIKNRKCGFEQLCQLGTKAQYRWGLSATPVENSIEDLVAVFDFLKPGLLKRDFENENTAQRKIKPHFLRRRTADVVKYFKEPRHESVVVEMEGRQLEAYEEAFRESVAELKKLGERVTLWHALQKLNALKQLCNVHLPSNESAKVDWLLDQLEQIKANRDKILLFTQYVEYGRDFLSTQLGKFGCVVYDSQGSDTQKRRWINSFVEDASKTVFLANPKVAGVGLPDLKVANYVIHFDHWWNPAVEDQANGRILGIGQKKDAFIVHLWVENSIEGRIQAILSRKRDLFARVIDAQSNVEGTGLTEEELFELFGLKAPTKKPKTGNETRQAESEGHFPRVDQPQQLNATEFEDLVARLYAGMGYAARRTPQTRDGGVDVIAIRDHATGRDKVAIQCKRQESPVGRPELQKLLGVISADPSFSAGTVVTSSTFSADARQFAEMNARLNLVDKNRLAQLLVHYRVPVKPD